MKWVINYHSHFKCEETELRGSGITLPRLQESCGARIGAGQAGHRAVCVHAPLGCQLILRASCWFPLAPWSSCWYICPCLSMALLGNKARGLFIPGCRLFYREAAQGRRFVERMSGSNMETVDPVHAETVWRCEGGWEAVSQNMVRICPCAGMGTMLLMWGHFKLAWRETFLSKDKN